MKGWIYRTKQVGYRRTAQSVMTWSLSTNINLLNDAFEEDPTSVIYAESAEEAEAILFDRYKVCDGVSRITRHGSEIYVFAAPYSDRLPWGDDAAVVGLVRAAGGKILLPCMPSEDFLDEDCLETRQNNLYTACNKQLLLRHDKPTNCIEVTYNPTQAKALCTRRSNAHRNAEKAKMKARKHDEKMKVARIKEHERKWGIAVDPNDFDYYSSLSEAMKHLVDKLRYKIKAKGFSGKIQLSIEDMCIDSWKDAWKLIEKFDATVRKFTGKKSVSYAKSSYFSSELDKLYKYIKDLRKNCPKLAAWITNQRRLEKNRERRNRCRREKRIAQWSGS